MSAQKPKRRSAKADLDLDPDAWGKFEQFIKDAAKSGPKHRPAKERPVSKGRVRKGKSRA
jgi:hypothetical protein